MPPTATGRVLPVLRKGFARPRVIVLLVLDGMRRDYFDRHAASMPTLTALRQRSAWFTQAQVNVLPSNTAVGHSTIATGTDPGVHGITGVSTYERRQRRRHDMFAGCDPQDLWHRRSQTSGSARPPGARSSWHREASTERRRRSQGMARVVEWNAGRARELRSTDGRLALEPRLFPAARLSEGSQREHAMEGQPRMDGTQDRLDRRPSAIRRCFRHSNPTRRSP